MISIRQIKAARALLEWTQDDLAKKAKVSIITIKRMEKEGLDNARSGTLQCIEDAFTSAGIEFIEDKAKEGAVVLKGKIKKK